MAETPTVVLNDGVSMPQLGLGLYMTPPDETAKVVRQAFAEGYRLFDTASMYGNEDGVGDALRDRPDAFVTTKLGNADHGFEKALRAFETSARRLKRETVDLYLVHWPRPRAGLTVETWKALVRLKGEGRIRSIGVSNFNADHLERIIGETGVAPSVNQIELHPRFQQERLRDVADRLGIRTQSWSPLGRATFLADPVIAGVAAKHGKTAAQVVIRWHLDNGLIPIPKSVRPARLKENIDVFDFRLDAEDLARMKALDRRDGRMGPDPATF